MTETPLAEAGVNRGGRPRRQVDVEQVKRLRAQGHSWREIACQLGLGYGTIHRAVRSTKSQPHVIQNPVAEAL